MNFSKEQRLIIAMLADLYRAPEDRELDPDFIQAAVSGGHDWAIEWKYGGLFPEEADGNERVSFVTDVLDMWDFIEEGFEALATSDKATVAAAIPYIGEELRFPGFDGNNESEHLAIARFLIERLDRFPRFAGRGLNSHSHTLERYERMVEAWRSIRGRSSYGQLTASDIIAIFNATHRS